MNWSAFGHAFVTLVVILDPLGGVPVFLTLTTGHEPRLRNRAAYQAIAVATAVIVVFALFGQLIIEYLGISLESLMVAGGVLLFIVALEMLRGGGDLLTVAHEEANVAFVPLGTPLLAGPGAIVATMVLMRQNSDFGGKVSVIVGVLVALAAVLASLRFASWCSRYLRPSAIHFLTRILGILLTAIAVQLVVSAIARWSRLGLDI